MGVHQFLSFFLYYLSSKSYHLHYITLHYMTSNGHLHGFPSVERLRCCIRAHHFLMSLIHLLKSLSQPFSQFDRLTSQHTVSFSHFTCPTSPPVLHWWRPYITSTHHVTSGKCELLGSVKPCPHWRLQSPFYGDYSRGKRRRRTVHTAGNYSRRFRRL